MNTNKENNQITYQDALNWIHDQLKFGIKPGIKRMEWLLNELGNPQDHVKGIHVVGTNGKGSTVNYLQAIFTQSGYEVGTFTSPYIMDFRERISVNAQMISKEELVNLVNIVKPIVERLPKETGYEPATEFEIITTMMFLYFGKIHPVDIAIIEAGIGGLYDSTNVFTPLVAICTSIGLDHQNILGTSYTDIAAQKVGILKESVPFVFAENRDDVRQVFYRYASKTNSPTYELNRDFSFKGDNNQFTFEFKNHLIDHLSLKMLGKHQMRNASLAIMSSILLMSSYEKLTVEHIRQALSQTFWLGRTEMMGRNLMIDGAHNNESIAVLVDVVKKYLPEKQIHILFSAINTKPIDSMLNQLNSIGEVAVTSFDYPNAVSIDNYPDNYKKVKDFKKWIDNINQSSQKDFYIITGSLYFISQVRHYLIHNR